MNEKENSEAKFLICKSGDLLLARRSQRLRRAGDYKGKKFSEIKIKKYEMWPLKTFEILKTYLKGKYPDYKIQDVILHFSGSHARVNDKGIIYSDND